MHALGKRIGGAVFPGAFIALYGDLGAGKTTLTKGIAEALGIVGILSPTFTIVRHHEGRLALDHFDAYRIEDPDELYAIGYEDHLSSGSVVIMEWCENVPDALPKDRLEIKIVGSGQDPRRVLIRTRGSGYEGILEAV
ncbi:MAG: tRNA (adenosine(37)-N6)-threonylcarbamoyltransferase complex ATPase subunit type 1 TsaE [Clostridia bacterium]|nr:tRNA (adenosine(37)-N6)-threonylcarbamoyltransferase complex ATPase subunit type 1 TsaE [Clostridia bacterium]